MTSPSNNKDINSILSASRSLSAETDIKSLVSKMIELIISIAGAERVTLLMKKGEEWLILGTGEFSKKKYTIFPNHIFTPDKISENHIPETVFNYVANSTKELIVGNALQDDRFANEIISSNLLIKSMACVPSWKEKNSRTLIYFDNSQVIDLFTPNRMDIIKQLSTQFDISLNNALNFDRLNQQVKELNKKDEHYKLAISGSSSGLWDWDLHSEKVFYSDRFKELLGYKPEEISDSLNEFWKRVHSDDIKIVEDAITNHLEKKSSYIIDYRLQIKSGEFKWFHARGQALWNDTGKAIRMSGSLTDITRRKIAEEKITRSEEQFRQLIEQSPLAIEILSPDGKINMINSAWKKLWKVNNEEAAETISKYNMLTDPQLKKLGIEEEVKEAFKGKHTILPPIQYDTALTIEDFDIKQLKNFRSPWIQCHLNVVKDESGTIEYIVNTYVDITDLKGVEETLSQSESRYRNLIEYSPLSIAIMTPEGKISQVNDSWRKYWGLTEEETTQVLENYNILTDEQIKESGHLALVERAFNGEPIILPMIEYEGERTIDELELDNIVPQSRWIQIHLYSVKDANGEIDSVISINMDFTDLKQVEKEVHQQREVLARLDRTSSMGQLTGSIAHELNQPLAGILSNAQAAEITLKNKNWNTNDLNEILADIVSDTKRASSIINNLRELYRNQDVKLEPNNLNDIVKDTLRLLNSELQLQKIKINSQYESNMPDVICNRIQIQQVLINLIMNGMQAMDDLDFTEQKLHISTTYSIDMVTVLVEDWGKGIDPEKIDHIFEPLASWKPSGTGMGLAISNSIILSHGGELIAKNKIEQGVVVSFSIPINLKDKANE